MKKLNKKRRTKKVEGKKEKINNILIAIMLILMLINFFITDTTIKNVVLLVQGIFSTIGVIMNTTDFFKIGKEEKMLDKRLEKLVNEESKKISEKIKKNKEERVKKLYYKILSILEENDLGGVTFSCKCVMWDCYSINFNLQYNYNIIDLIKVIFDNFERKQITNFDITDRIGKQKIEIGLKISEEELKELENNEV